MKKSLYEIWYDNGLWVVQLRNGTVNFQSKPHAVKFVETTKLADPCRKTDEMETTLRKRWEQNDWGLQNIGIFMTDAERTAAFDCEAGVYCTQNNQDCITCSLVNYGKDCHNNEISKAVTGCRKDG